ncbi:MAG: spore cortex biosynthesis protein YabQ, partial [Clostridia bacterium]|nr:spore cortex biosynthesis protein YabQ [Clostridia bacterium]
MNQFLMTLYSVALGMFLGIFYDVFRVIRLLINPRNLSIFIEDIIYFLVSGFVTFIFVLILNYGESRFYILAGEALG